MPVPPAPGPAAIALAAPVAAELPSPQERQRVDDVSVNQRPRQSTSPAYQKPGSTTPGLRFGLARWDDLFPQACTPSRLSMAALNSLRCFTPLNCCLSSLFRNNCTVGVPLTPACWAIA